MIDLLALKSGVGSFGTIRERDRVWTAREISACALAVADELRRTFPKVAATAPRIFVPTASAPFFLASLLGCTAAAATAIPYGDTGGKGAEALQPLVLASAVLTFHSGAPRLDVLAPASETPPRRGDVILTTTGSTGAPKGVCLDLTQLWLNALLAGHRIGMRANLRWVCGTDLSLTSGLCHMLMAWIHGADFVHLPDYAEKHNTEMFTDRAYGFGGAPIHLLRMSDLAGNIDPPETLMSSGDFLTAPMVERIMSVFPTTRLHKFYGLTEVAGRFCSLDANDIDTHPDAAGRPLPGFQIRISNDAGADQLPGERGEVQLKSPLLMHGYLHAGERFERTDPGSWFGTRDEGFMDETGRLTLVGRTDFSFKVGGEKADVLSIEKALRPVLGSRVYCVMPVPHETLGQCGALFVEKSLEGQETLWREAVSSASKQLPSRFVPMFGYVLESLPRLANGKIDRVALVRNAASYERLR